MVIPELTRGFCKFVHLCPKGHGKGRVTLEWRCHATLIRGSALVAPDAQPPGRGRVGQPEGSGCGSHTSLTLSHASPSLSCSQGESFMIDQ